MKLSPLLEKESAYDAEAPPCQSLIKTGSGFLNDRQDRCKRTLVALLVCGTIFVVGMLIPKFIGLDCPLGPFVGLREPRRELIDLGGRLQTVVVHHTGREAKEGRVSSPSIVTAPDDPLLLIASSDRVSEPIVDISRSRDGGESWALVSVLKGAYWSTLFFHRGSLYLLGPSKEYGDMLIRRSEDFGSTWTNPDSPRTGMLTEGERWHRGAVPVISHHGRLWHAAEALSSQENLVHGLSTMWSADEGSDLLDANSWRRSNSLPFPNDLSTLPFAPREDWLAPSHWLEGNAVVSPKDSSVSILLRVESIDGGIAARVTVDEETHEAAFERFVSFPGGAKKFMVQRDPESGRYVALSNVLVVPSDSPAALMEELEDPEEDVWLQLPMSVLGDSSDNRKRYLKAGDRRNALALVSSSDLSEWTVHEILFYEEDLTVGMQYPGFIISGDDLLLVLRTAAPYQGDEPSRALAANLMTFYRLQGFRDLLSREILVKVEQQMAG